MTNFFTHKIDIQLFSLLKFFFTERKWAKKIVFGLVFTTFFSCSHPTPRKPVNRTSGYDASESIAFNKMLYQQESDLIKNFMLKDSTHQYIDSHLGFWYTFLTENKTDSVFPVKGDIVTFQYNVHDFNGKQIYSTDEIGRITYKVDQEEIIQGINEGIKNMNQGEKVLFLFPSHKAFAYHGDDQKIGSNTPIIVNLELFKIETNKH